MAVSADEHPEVTSVEALIRLKHLQLEELSAERIRNLEYAAGQNVEKLSELRSETFATETSFKQTQSLIHGQDVAAQHCAEKINKFSKRLREGQVALADANTGIAEIEKEHCFEEVAWQEQQDSLQVQLQETEAKSDGALISVTESVRHAEFELTRLLEKYDALQDVEHAALLGDGERRLRQLSEERHLWNARMKAIEDKQQQFARGMEAEVSDAWSEVAKIEDSKTAVEAELESVRSRWLASERQSLHLASSLNKLQQSQGSCALELQECKKSQEIQLLSCRCEVNEVEEQIFSRKNLNEQCALQHEAAVTKVEQIAETEVEEHVAKYTKEMDRYRVDADAKMCSRLAAMQREVEEAELQLQQECNQSFSLERKLFQEDLLNINRRCGAIAKKEAHAHASSMSELAQDLRNAEASLDKVKAEAAQLGMKACMKASQLEELKMGVFAVLQQELHEAGDELCHLNLQMSFVDRESHVAQELMEQLRSDLRGKGDRVTELRVELDSKHLQEEALLDDLDKSSQNDFQPMFTGDLGDLNIDEHVPGDSGSRKWQNRIQQLEQEKSSLVLQIQDYQSVIGKMREQAEAIRDKLVNDDGLKEARLQLEASEEHCLRVRQENEILAGDVARLQGDRVRLMELSNSLQFQLNNPDVAHSEDIAPPAPAQSPQHESPADAGSSRIAALEASMKELLEENRALRARLSAKAKKSSPVMHPAKSPSASVQPNLVVYNQQPDVASISLAGHAAPMSPTPAAPSASGRQTAGQLRVHQGLQAEKRRKEELLARRKEAVRLINQRELAHQEHAPRWLQWQLHGTVAVATEESFGQGCSGTARGQR
eukprot:gnl/MRDRNA2_/MRDRNA2_31515_c0_seq1.p1 gnl/MRDRNA2_/MRDRNA2_31515_c0~~gnl/MRDRNA2_/MRDRNA2_31515_c0_seq1.p1  ORF type:complete len:855 (-),score=256.60 gnl/MRDRNA2_/MRDRNA2_31515_c0_seq1:90-2585(-)